MSGRTPFFGAAVPRRVSTARALIVAGLVGALCLACSSGEIRVSSGAGSTLLVHDVRGRGDDAEINGYLQYLDHADCFVLESEPGAGQLMRHIVVWPPGTRVWHEGGELRGVRVPRVDAISLGDWVAGGGGYANPTTSEMDLPEVSSDCVVGGGEFAFLHRISETSSGRP